MSGWVDQDAPTTLIENAIGSRVTLITSWGIELEGRLEGVDAAANYVLADVVETNCTNINFGYRRHPQSLVAGSSISMICLAQH